MGSGLLWIFLCFVSMQLSTVFNSYEELVNTRFVWVDPVFYVSLIVSLLLFVFGVTFQYSKFGKYKKVLSYGHSDSRSRSFFETIGHSLKKGPDDSTRDIYREVDFSEPVDFNEYLNLSEIESDKDQRLL